MPRPEQTPTPQFEGLPYGANSLANDMSEDLDDDGVDPSFDELEDFEPGTDEESFLFAPTDRPGEPITAGMSFGAGPDITRFAHETPNELMSRVATQLSVDVSAPKEVRAFVERHARGY